MFPPAGRDGCSCNSFRTLLWLSGPMEEQIDLQIDVWKRCNERWLLLLLRLPLLLIQAGLGWAGSSWVSRLLLPCIPPAGATVTWLGGEKSLCSIIAAWDGWSEKDIEGERVGVVLSSPWLWQLIVPGRTRLHMWYSLNERLDTHLHNIQRCDTLNDLNLGWQHCDSTTLFPCCRGASTVTTTARWGGRRTPTWPYPPATACSKSMLAAHTCCVDNICRDIHPCCYWLGIDCLPSPLHLSHPAVGCLMMAFICI